MKKNEKKNTLRAKPSKVIDFELSKHQQRGAGRAGKGSERMVKKGGKDGTLWMTKRLRLLFLASKFYVLLRYSAHPRIFTSLQQARSELLGRHMLRSRFRSFCSFLYFYISPPYFFF